MISGRRTAHAKHSYWRSATFCVILAPSLSLWHGPSPVDWSALCSGIVYMYVYARYMHDYEYCDHHHHPQMTVY